MSSRTTTIARLVAVTDTRDMIEDGDRFVPIPGTGDARPCDRCGRTHEVHATVELSDGTTATVGTGCAAHAGWIAPTTARSLPAAAKAVAALTAQLAHRQAQVIEYLTARAGITATPDHTVSPHHTNEEITVWTTTDGICKVMVFSGADHTERLACLHDLWITKQTILKVGHNVHHVGDLPTRLARAEVRLAKLLAA